MLWDSDVKVIFECGDVHGVECGHDVEWSAEMRFDVKYGVMSVYVKCGAM